MSKFIFLVSILISSQALAVDNEQVFNIIADNAAGNKHDQEKINEFVCTAIGDDCDLVSDPLAQSVYRVGEDKYIVMVMEEGVSFNHMYDVVFVKKVGSKITAMQLEDFSYYDVDKKKFVTNDAPQGFTNLSYDNGLFHAYVTGDSQGYCRQDTYYSFNNKTDKLDIVKITETNECSVGKDAKVKTITLYKKK